MRIALPLGGTDLGRSGIGIYVREVIPRLHRRLVDGGGSLVVLGAPNELSAYRAELEGIESVATPAWTERPGASAAFHLALAGIVAARERAEVLLLPAGNRRMTLYSPVPTVSVVHDLAQLHVREKYDPLRMFYIRRVLVGALATADRLVAVSHATAEDVRAALGARCPPLDVVENGVDHERFAPLPPEHHDVVAARAAYDLERPYLLYPSRLEHPGKNHLRLLTAYSRSRARRTHDLVLAGKDWGARERIEARTRELGISSQVRLLGFAPDELLPGLVAGADAVVMVGLREGFGLPALEALGAGRPVCAARAGALPEVVGDLGALCDPLDEDSIAQALDAVIEDDGLRAAAAERGPSRAEARSWSRTTDGLHRACAQALGE